MIAMVVYNVNQSHYWIVHHGVGLRKIIRDSEFVDKFIEYYKNSDISEQDNTMLDYVVKLTKEPWNMVKDDIQSLRKASFSAEGILDIVQDVGY